jgi:heme oxygenase (mycobilin-producing)
MLVINRFVVGTADREAFTGRAHTALEALAGRPGYLRGRLARAYDEPEHWCLVTEWESVGAYRRALSAFDVKVKATPLLAEALPEPSAYEVLATADGPGAPTVLGSDLAAEPER